ncbi:hypothetical protein [Streptomyces sp. NBC_01716]|uniref:hypothetical protein n=1 Tax=Streptomyces sp. NBC_01716 TaxID=2975917 RepID=UPI002E37D8FA|nr:hypothetical protein [Streptomyces sp. NBC_01716]
MEVSKLVLEYLKVVIWPVTVIGLMWFLRAHLREAFGRLTRLETPLGAADFEADARHLRLRTDELPEPEPEPEPEELPEPEPESEELPERVPVSVPREETAGTRVRARLAALVRLKELERERLEVLEALKTFEESENRLQASGARARLRALETQVRGLIPELGGSSSSTESAWARRLDEAGAVAAVSPVGAIITAWEAVRDLGERILPAAWSGPRAGRPRNLADEMRRAGMPASSVKNLSELRALRNRAVHGEPVSVQGALDFVAAARGLSYELELFTRSG